MQTIDPQYTQSSASLSASYLHSIVPKLKKRYDIDMDALVARVGIEASQLNDPEYLIPFFRVGAFFLELLRETGDPALGLEIGCAVEARSYHVLGYAIVSSSTIAEAIDRLIRYEQLAGKLGATSLHPGDPVKLQWHCPFDGPFSFYLKEAAIAGWITFGKSLVADAASPLGVYFDHACTTDISRYEEAFGAPVYFDSDWSGVTFSADDLKRPVVSADPGLMLLMGNQAMDRLEKFDHRINLVNEVRAEVAKGLPNGEPSLESVAEPLDLTPRALQNRLKGADISFKDVVDEVREQLAYAYLADESTSLLDIAFLLGFAEQSSFSRAFKRWSGVSPIEFRKTLLASTV
ncbi:MAG: AraC family transcriptional regulator [Pseudomonadales bacterium]|nr:AraC family transcriptional regulator [Pseudomonadales bacterium]